MLDPRILRPLDDLVESKTIDTANAPKGVVDTGRGFDGKLYMVPTGVFSQRTIIPGRVTFAGINEPIACGGVLVRKDDIVGCDGRRMRCRSTGAGARRDHDCQRHLFDDAHKRRALYERLDMPPDERVDAAAMEAFLADF